MYPRRPSKKADDGSDSDFAWLLTRLGDAKCILLLMVTPEPERGFPHISSLPLVTQPATLNVVCCPRHARAAPTMQPWT